MKILFTLLPILITFNVSLAQDDDRQLDNEQNVDGNQGEDGPPREALYPDGDPNQGHHDNQMNYGPPLPPGPPQDSEIRCSCGEVAKLCVVKKDSPNKGRGMYVCPRPQHDPERCNFFLWADQAEAGGGGQNFARSNRGYGGAGGGGGNYQRRDNFRARNPNYYQGGGGGGGGGPNGPPSYNRARPNYARSYDGPPQPPPPGPNDETILCACGAPAKKFIVKKDTPNKGREFYCCPRMRNDPERCNFFLWAN